MYQTSEGFQQAAEKSKLPTRSASDNSLTILKNTEKQNNECYGAELRPLTEPAVVLIKFCVILGKNVMLAHI